MKVRWTGQSVRLRISPSELDCLLRGGDVIETLLLPYGGSWSATLAVADDATGSGEVREPGLALEDGNLRLTLSPSELARLAAPEAEGVYFETAGQQPSVRYYVEKDFPCAHPGAPEAREPPAETFAPPPGFKERHGATCG